MCPGVIPLFSSSSRRRRATLRSGVCGEKWASSTSRSIPSPPRNSRTRLWLCAKWKHRSVGSDHGSVTQDSGNIVRSCWCFSQVGLAGVVLHGTSEGTCSRGPNVFEPTVSAERRQVQESQQGCPMGNSTGTFFFNARPLKVYNEFPKGFENRKCKIFITKHVKFETSQS